MAKEITNARDIIDSREVIARIEELADLLSPQDENDAIEESEDYEDEREELENLKALAKEGEASPDWQHGEALIRDDHFAEYAKELAYDVGAVDRNAQWPLNHIDWEAAADDLKQDYICVDFDGVEYWIRA